MKASSRQEAHELRLKKFFTGIPCINGHIDYRDTVSGSCAQCTREANARRRQEIRNKLKENK